MMKMTNAEIQTYIFEKKKYQDIYGWTNEQFDKFWTNPHLNAYSERKAEMIEFAEFLLRKR